MIITYNKADVVCHTPDCSNKDAVLHVLMDLTNASVVCGVCVNPITDVTITGTETRDE